MLFEVQILRIPSDNYTYLIRYDSSAIAVDPGEASAVLKELKRQKLSLETILCTHNHFDHTGGVNKLQSETGCKVVRKRKDSDDRLVIDNKISIKVMYTPGHTKDSVCYYFEDRGMIFTGDTLFRGGCGRVFEGTCDMLYDSLMKISDLPEETLIYDGHDYLKDNYDFALAVDKNNELLKKRYELALKQTILPPSDLKFEKQTNPFLRCNTEDLKRYFHAENESSRSVFRMLREKKNTF